MKTAHNALQWRWGLALVLLIALIFFSTVVKIGGAERWSNQLIPRPSYYGPLYYDAQGEMGGIKNMPPTYYAPRFYWQPTYWYPNAYPYYHYDPVYPAIDCPWCGQRH